MYAMYGKHYNRNWILCSHCQLISKVSGKLNEEFTNLQQLSWQTADAAGQFFLALSQLPVGKK